MATLFNDRFGQFHVEKSAFQKTCYARHLSKDELVETAELTKCSVSYNEKKAAEGFLEAGEVDEALAAVNQWSNSNEKATFLNKICEVFITKGEFDKVLDIKGLYAEVKMNFVVEIGYKYLSSNDCDNALLIAEKISDKSRKESLKISIAKHFLKNEKFFEAVEVLRSLDYIWGKNSDDDERLTRLLLGISDECTKKNETNTAFNVIELISVFSQGLETREVRHLNLILQRFAEEGDEEGVLKAFKLLVQRSYLDYKPIRDTDSAEKCLVLPLNIMGSKRFNTRDIFDEFIKDIIFAVGKNNVIQLKLGESSVELVEKKQVQKTKDIYSRDYIFDYEQDIRAKHFQNTLDNFTNQFRRNKIFS